MRPMSAEPWLLRKLLSLLGPMHRRCAVRG
jgi:hypothetical protein